MVVNRPLSGYLMGAAPFYRTTKGDKCFHLSMAVENATVLAVKVQHPLGSDLVGVNRPQPKEVTKQSNVP